MRILLIHFGQLGDAVLAIPAARALRGHYPEAHITVLASGGGAGIFRLLEFDDVQAVDRVAWKVNWARAVREIPGLVLRLRREQFDLSVDLHSYKETNLLAWLAGIPRRVAMLRPTRSLASLINVKPPPDDPDGVLLDRYCRVLQPLGITVSDRVPRLSPPPAAVARVADLLKDFNGASLLGICPGAGHPLRRWPAERFAAVARALRTDTALAPVPHTIVFAGPEEEEGTLSPFRSLEVTSIIGGLSLAELAAALARCRVVLSNPTGPSHVAAAVGTRVVSIGEIPQFDPVGRVRVVRAAKSVSDVEQQDVLAAVREMWTAN